MRIEFEGSKPIWEARGKSGGGVCYIHVPPEISGEDVIKKELEAIVGERAISTGIGPLKLKVEAIPVTTPNGELYIRFKPNGQLSEDEFKRLVEEGGLTDEQAEEIRKVFVGTPRAKREVFRRARKKVTKGVRG